jgi:adenine phosphoribosyltransferase
MEIAELRGKIRDIKNFPAEGILFKDITTLLKDGPAFRFVIDDLARMYVGERVDVVVAVESRGFIFGGALAHELNCGFVPVRKLGKLPGKTVEVDTSWSTADASPSTRTPSAAGRRVLVVDDLLATGGPWRPPCASSTAGGVVVGVAWIELAFLHGRETQNYPCTFAHRLRLAVAMVGEAVAYWRTCNPRSAR